MNIRLGQYSQYVINGSLVAMVAILIREGVALILSGGTTWEYALSIVITYGIGILLSFWLQRGTTFRDNVQGCQQRAFALYFAVAVSGGVVTTLLSVLCRNLLGFETFFDELADSAAFATGALLSSLLTYWLNLRYVFTAARSA